MKEPQRVLRMSEAEADAWLDGLKAHIKKQHPHLDDPTNTGLSQRGLLLKKLPWVDHETA